MTINIKGQQEFYDKDKILNKVLEIKRIKKLSQKEIHQILGYKNDVFSQISSGYSNGSPQLLAAITLMLENLELKKRNIELEQALRTIQTVKYPGHQAGKDFQMNEVNLGNTGKAQVMNVEQKPLVIPPAPAVAPPAGRHGRAKATSGRRKNNPADPTKTQ